VTTSITQRQDVQAFLRVASNLDREGGNPRVKQVVHRLLSDLFRTIEDLDLTPDEVWAGINYINDVGARSEAALLAAGLGLEHFLDLRLDAEDAALGIPAGTPRTIEGPLYVAGAPVSDGTARMDTDPDTGDTLFLHGRVLDPDGQPVRGAIVEAWHANSKGFYSHFDPTGTQSPFNLRRAVRTDADGRYEFRTLVPVGYGCPPDGPTLGLLTQLGRHGNRPAHIHLFVTAPGLRKLTTQINIADDPLVNDDFAYATREGLIPEMKRIADGTARGLATGYVDIEFDIRLTPLVEGEDNQVVDRRRVAA
jgi:catechol 1,2-dioxygenase